MPTTTDLGDYNMVIAVTEDAVNNAIQYSNIWKVPINCQLNTAVDAAASPGIIDGAISVPVISLTGHDLNSNQANVTLNFTGGTLQYVDVITGAITQPTTDLTGWSVSFNSELSNANLDNPANISDLPEAVQEALSSDILSVGQLFLNLETIVWAYATITDGNGDPVTDSIIQSTFTESLQGFAQSVEETASAWVINYLISSDDPTSGGTVIPQLVPTSYDYSVSPYNPSTAGYDNLSTINYMMMTNGATPPSGGALPAGINWVPGPNTAEYQGTFGIDGALFNSAYVVPSVLPAVASALKVNKSFSSSNGMSPWSLSASKVLTPVEQTNWFETLITLGETVYQDVTQDINCTVEISPTDGKYNVSGTFKAVCTIDIHYFGQSIGGYNQSFWQDWTFDIDVTPSGDGISLKAENFNLGDMQQSDVEGNQSDSGFGHNLSNILSDAMAGAEDLLGNLLSTYETDFADDFQNNVQNIDLKAASDSLNAAFSTLSNSIVFPGGDAFFYKDVFFTADAEQNLIAFVTYQN